MDEQSFFGGLLHVCYAPEFETVEETRKKLQERNAYVARMTKNKDHYVTKKHKDAKDFRGDFHSKTSRFPAASLKTSTGNSDLCLPYSSELPLCYFSPKCTCSSGEHVDRPSDSSQDGRNSGESLGRCDHCDSLQKMQMKTSQNSLARRGAQKTLTPSEAADRFMPRTTQLQERKRRREDDCKRGTLLDACTSSNEAVIGPQLPVIPKVDMHDDSLNTTANLIRNKLKEVISSVPKPPEDKVEDVPRSRPLKQRRRI
ncbi:RNA-binding protein 48 isoform X2 [Muntiacus reevesi]